MTDTPSDPLPAFTEHRVQRDRGSLHLRDFSGRGPAFAVLHGFPDNSHIYDDLLPHFASAGRRIVAIDFWALARPLKQPSAGQAFAQMTYRLNDKIAANSARLLEFRRSAAPLLLIWGKFDPYLHVSVANFMRS